MTIISNNISQPIKPDKPGRINAAKKDALIQKGDSVDLSSSKITPEKDWSILIYMNDNNNLSEQGKAKFGNQLKEIDKSDKMNVAVQASWLRTRGWNSPYGVDCQRYEVKNNSIEKFDKMGAVNMASPESLADFLKWGMKNYPAKHYMVVLQGHGSAWHGALPDDVSKERMDLSQIDAAFKEAEKETGVKPDVIAFDNCLMGNMETAYQMKDNASIMIGSEEVEWGIDSEYAEEVSVPYKKIFNQTSQKLDAGFVVGPEALAKDWVKACEGEWTTPTQSAVDLKQVGPLAESLDKLALSILNGKTPMSDIRRVAKDTKHMRNSEVDKWYQHDDYKLHLRDVREFAMNLVSDTGIKDKNIKKAAKELIKSFDKAVIANEAGSEYSHKSPVRYSDDAQIYNKFEGDKNHGLSIFIPTDPKVMEYLEGADKYPVKYRDVDFAAETNWGRLAERLAQED